MEVLEKRKKKEEKNNMEKILSFLSLGGLFPESLFFFALWFLNFLLLLGCSLPFLKTWIFEIFLSVLFHYSLYISFRDDGWTSKWMSRWNKQTVAMSISLYQKCLVVISELLP